MSVARIAFLGSLLRLGVLVVPPMCLINWAFDGDPFAFGLWPTATAVVVGTSLTAVWCAVFSYRVGPEGISCETFAGQRVWRWSEVESATVRKLPFRYVVVSAADDRTMWIPGSLKDPASFAKAVIAHAPHDHAMARAAREAWMVSGELA